MLEILEFIVATLKADATLTAIVPATQILTGPVDITMQTQASLLYPQINIHTISEAQRSNPLETRDTQVQVDIWSRNSQLEIENIYEQIITDLAYQTQNKNTAHIFWSRLAGSVDVYETGGTRRIWHRAVTFSFWTLKPNG